jgi:hypothetical protein
MQKKSVFQLIRVLFLAAVILVGTSPMTYAETPSTSPNYQLSESQFNGGSAYESCSEQYCAKVSIGDIADNGVAPSSSAGFATIPQDSEPLLEVIVDAGVSTLGVLDTQTTGSKTMTVRIRNYLSGGYTLQITGNPPKYSGHTLKTFNEPTASQAGTEQFGINVVANSVPNVGADPIQIPSAQTSFGQVTEKYKIANWFKYTSGDVVARSATESGRTDYTVSMIVNISNATPAGQYTGDFSAVVVPVF